MFFSFLFISSALVVASQLILYNPGDSFHLMPLKALEDGTLSPVGSPIEFDLGNNGTIHVTDSTGKVTGLTGTVYGHHNDAPQFGADTDANDDRWNINEKGFLVYNNDPGFYLCRGWNNKINYSIDGKAPTSCKDALAVSILIYEE